MVDGPRLDREALLRAETRRVLADLRLYGVPDRDVVGLSLDQLWQLRHRTIRDLMGAPRRAA